MPAALLLVATEVRADDPITIESSTETSDQTTPSPRHHEAPPLLEFDPTVRVSLERLDRQVTRIQLTPAADLAVSGAWRGFDPQQVGERKTPLWRAGISGSYDLGFARLSGSVMYEQVSTEHASAAAKVYELSVSRAFRISRTTTGFVKLGASRREWRDHLPLPGEFDDTRVMLWFGLTW